MPTQTDKSVDVNALMSDPWFLRIYISAMSVVLIVVLIWAWHRGNKRLGAVFTTPQFIGYCLYYAICLLAVALVLYSVSFPIDDSARLDTSLFMLWLDRILKPIRGSAVPRVLAKCFCLGCIGAVVYGMLRISRGDDEIHGTIRLRRLVLLPPLGGVLGSMSYLFLRAGMLTLSAGAGNNGNLTMSSFAVDAFAFLAGFASRELAQKLFLISESFFAKAEDGEGPTGRARLEEQLEVHSAALEKMPPPQRADILIEEGKELADRGRVDRAMETLLSAASADPQKWPSIEKVVRDRHPLFEDAANYAVFNRKRDQSRSAPSSTGTTLTSTPGGPVGGR